jgi:hypothetical protein
MSPLEQSDIEYGKAREKVSYFTKSKEVQPGSSVVLEITDVEKYEGSKFPILGETWCYRFRLKDGRVWDENAASLFGKIIKLLYPDGKTFKPCAVKLTKLTVKPMRGSQYTVDKA